MPLTVVEMQVPVAGMPLTVVETPDRPRLAPFGRVLRSHLGHSEPTTPSAPGNHTVMQAWSARYGVTSSLTLTEVGGGVTPGKLRWVEGVTPANLEWVEWRGPAPRDQVRPPPLSLLLVLEGCQPRLDFNRGGVGLKLRELTLQ